MIRRMFSSAVAWALPTKTAADGRPARALANPEGELLALVERQSAPTLAADWCPRCEPERDPSTELIAPLYCLTHDEQAVAELGRNADDERVGQAEYYLAGSAAIDGRQNRIWCDFFHRRIEPLRGEEGDASPGPCTDVAKPSTSLGLP